MTGPGYETRGLGPRTQTGISDATVQLNPYLLGTGWDVIFAPQDLNFYDPEVEVYHIALDGPVGSSAQIYRDNRPWDFVAQAWSNGWDPSQPMLLNPGHSVQFCWNVAFAAGPYNKTSNVQPVVTLWLRKPLPRTVIA